MRTKRYYNVRTYNKNRFALTRRDIKNIVREIKAYDTLSACDLLRRISCIFGKTATIRELKQLIFLVREKFDKKALYSLRTAKHKQKRFFIKRV